MAKMQRTKSSQNKTLFGASIGLGAIVLSVFIANSRLVKQQEGSATLASKSSRGIASVEGVELFAPNEEYTQKILQEFKQDVKSSTLGKKPSLADKLSFERLEGKYQVLMEGDLVSKIIFDETQNLPSEISNTQEFVKEYASLFGSTGEVALTGSKLERDHKIEIFRLGGTESKSSVLVIKDLGNHLLSLEVTQ